MKRLGQAWNKDQDVASELTRERESCRRLRFEISINFVVYMLEISEIKLVSIVRV